MTTPSWRISNKLERGERKNAIYSGHLRLCQQPRVAHALCSDQIADAIKQTCCRERLIESLPPLFSTPPEAIYLLDTTNAVVKMMGLSRFSCDLCDLMGTVIGNHLFLGQNWGETWGEMPVNKGS